MTTTPRTYDRDGNRTDQNKGQSKGAVGSGAKENRRESERKNVRSSNLEDKDDHSLNMDKDFDKKNSAIDLKDKDSEGTEKSLK